MASPDIQFFPNGEHNEQAFEPDRRGPYIVRECANGPGTIPGHGPHRPEQFRVRPTVLPLGLATLCPGRAADAQQRTTPVQRGDNFGGQP